MFLRTIRNTTARLLLITCLFTLSSSQQHLRAKHYNVGPRVTALTLLTLGIFGSAACLTHGVNTETANKNLQELAAYLNDESRVTDPEVLTDFEALQAEVAAQQASFKKEEIVTWSALGASLLTTWGSAGGVWWAELAGRGPRSKTQKPPAAPAPAPAPEPEPAPAPEPAPEPAAAAEPAPAGDDRTTGRQLTIVAERTPAIQTPPSQPDAEDAETERTLSLKKVTQATITLSEPAAAPKRETATGARTPAPGAYNVDLSQDGASTEKALTGTHNTVMSYGVGAISLAALVASAFASRK